MVRTTALLIVLAAVLSASPLAAQDLSATRRFHAEPGVAGRYYLSLPFGGGLEDLANSSLSDPCDLSSASADGVLNADDLICTIWGAGDLASRHGVITVFDYTPDCRVRARTALRTRFGGPVLFIGSAFDLRPEAGFQVSVAVLPDQPLPDDTVTFTGPCAPALPLQVVGGACPFALLNLPYDTLFRTANDILCGLENIWWYDADGDGDPDTCPHGLFDAVDGLPVTISYYQNRWDEFRDPRSGPVYIPRAVFSSFGDVYFIGTNFDLVDGDGIIVEFSTGDGERDWDPPVEDCP